MRLRCSNCRAQDRVEHKQTIVLRKDLNTRVSRGFRYGRATLP
jgi:hypothetical protein